MLNIDHASLSHLTLADTKFHDGHSNAKAIQKRIDAGEIPAEHGNELLALNVSSRIATTVWTLAQSERIPIKQALGIVMDHIRKPKRTGAVAQTLATNPSASSDHGWARAIATVNAEFGISTGSSPAEKPIRGD